MLMLTMMGVSHGRALGIEKSVVGPRRTDDLQRDASVAADKETAIVPQQSSDDASKGDASSKDNKEDGSATIPLLVSAKEKVKDGKGILMIKGSGFEEEGTLTCRMTGFDIIGGVSVEADKKKTTRVNAMFVSDRLVKCPYSAKLQQMLEVIVEVSNDGEHFSTPLIYYPQRTMVPPKASGDDSEDKSKADDKSTADDKSATAAEGSTSEGLKDKGKNEENAKSKSKSGSGASDDDDTDGVGDNWGFGEIQGAPSAQDWRHNPLQSTMETIRERPHLSGLLAGVVGLFFIGTMYKYCGRRSSRGDLNYTRVRTSEGNEAVGNGANGRSLFGIYDDEEENGAGWGEWDNDWEKGEEAGENGVDTSRKGRKGSD